MARGVELLDGAQALLERLGGDPVGVDPAAVVGDLDHDLAARVVRAQRQHALGGLAGGDALLGGLDPVVDGVAHEVGQRVLDGLEQPAVELGVATGHLELDLALARGREVAHDARHLRPDVLDGLHARLHDALLQLTGDEVEPLRGPRQVDVVGPGGEPADLVAGQDELAHLTHERVEQVDVDADRRVGRTAQAGDGLVVHLLRAGRTGLGGDERLHGRGPDLRGGGRGGLRRDLDGGPASGSTSGWRTR